MYMSDEQQIVYIKFLLLLLVVYVKQPSVSADPTKVEALTDALTDALTAALTG
jgi:hypothetical protein